MISYIDLGSTQMRSRLLCGEFSVSVKCLKFRVRIICILWAVLFCYYNKLMNVSRLMLLLCCFTVCDDFSCGCSFCLQRAMTCVLLFGLYRCACNVVVDVGIDTAV